MLRKIQYVLMVCIGALLSSACTISGPNKDIGTTGEQACFDTRCFDIEIADTPQERKRGLMRREELAQDHGMLFVFATSAPGRSFRMKNTLIPLDIVWLDETGRIVHIEQDVPPCEADPCPSFGPPITASTSSTYVLELNAGTVNSLQAELGDRVKFSAIKDY